MRFNLVIPAVAALLLGACSSPPAPDDGPVSAVSAPVPRAAPADATLGSAAWYAWVDKNLGISDGQGHGPDPGSEEWNRAVQRKLGQEAPQSKPGSPEWQQSVDGLLRTRLPAGASSTHP